MGDETFIVCCPLFAHRKCEVDILICIGLSRQNQQSSIMNSYFHLITQPKVQNCMHRLRYYHGVQGLCWSGWALAEVPWSSECLGPPGQLDVLTTISVIVVVFHLTLRVPEGLWAPSNLELGQMLLRQAIFFLIFDRWFILPHASIKIALYWLVEMF